MRLTRILAVLAVCLATFACQTAEQPQAFEPAKINDQYPSLKALGMPISKEENKEFSFTNKRSSYYYARGYNQPNNDWFSGWNVTTRRIFKDYQLYVNGTPLSRAESQLTVYPNEFVRTYPQATEVFTMFDHQDVLGIFLQVKSSDKIGISLIEENQLKFIESADGIDYFTPVEADDKVLAVTTISPTSVQSKQDGDQVMLTGGAEGQGFLIAMAESKSAVKTLLQEAQKNYESWMQKRAERMEYLLTDYVPLTTNNDTLNKAFRWVALTMDQLVTKQMGDGIYAGLPWFTDYWARDLFISFPGAVLVTGQYDVARNILLSFARYQNTDKNSKFYGRVPNRANPDGIIYNTTDGTPRFLIEMLNYVRYSGDTAIIRELYPAVQRSIEGPVKYWLDDKGYLTHDDADTWMDAKWNNKIPISPRGSRANDIQALWYDQLQAGVYFANFMHDRKNAAVWGAIAAKVKENFMRDFHASGKNMLADRLTAKGEQDFSMRPNQLFALDLVDDPALRMRITRTTWDSLVYPWGVASLSQMDDNFHPYHENWDYYHKDAGYHNGTVWIWNNGIAMQRMLEAGQKDIAWHLFNNMSEQALIRGAVGSLSENTDALPRPGADWVKFTGTFLQAWSNSEYLRVWYQYFLGIRPDVLADRLTLVPQIPTSIDVLDTEVRLGAHGHMSFEFRRTKSEETYSYHFEGSNPRVTFKLPGYPEVKFNVEGDDEKLMVKDDLSSKKLQVVIMGKGGAVKRQFQVAQSEEELKKIEVSNKIFEGTTFAKPYLRPGLKSIAKKNPVKH